MEILYRLSSYAGVLLSTVGDEAAGIIGRETTSATATAVANAADGAAAAAPTATEGFMSMLPTILIYGGVLFALYWFMFRPQRKREKEIQEMRKELKTGDNIITSSGFYGKIVDTEDNCFIIEFGTNKGIRVPVKKTEIIGVQGKVPQGSQSDTK